MMRDDLHSLRYDPKFGADMSAFIHWSTGAIIMYDSRTPCMPWGEPRNVPGG